MAKAVTAGGERVLPLEASEAKDTTETSETSALFDQTPNEWRNTSSTEATAKKAEASAVNASDPTAVHAENPWAHVPVAWCAMSSATWLPGEGTAPAAAKSEQAGTVSTHEFFTLVPTAWLSTCGATSYRGGGRAGEAGGRELVEHDRSRRVGAERTAEAARKPRTSVRRGNVRRLVSIESKTQCQGAGTTIPSRHQGNAKKGLPASSKSRATRGRVRSAYPRRCGWAVRHRRSG